MVPRSHLSERTERAASGCIRKAFGPAPVIGKPWREQSSRGKALPRGSTVWRYGITEFGGRYRSAITQIQQGLGSFTEARFDHFSQMLAEACANLRVGR